MKRGGSTFIIAPLSCVKEWHEQIEIHLHPAHRPSVLVLNDPFLSPYEPLKYEIIITTYRFIQRGYAQFQKIQERIKNPTKSLPKRITSPLFSSVFVDLQKPFLRIVCDEYHTIKNTTAAITLSICALYRKSIMIMSGSYHLNRWEESCRKLKIRRSAKVCEPIIYCSYTY